MLRMFKYNDECVPEITKLLINERTPTMDLKAGLPADILFMFARYGILTNDEPKVKLFIDATIEQFTIVTEESTDIDILIFWLVNSCRLLSHLQNCDVECNKNNIPSLRLKKIVNKWHHAAVRIYERTIETMKDKIDSFDEEGCTRQERFSNSLETILKELMYWMVILNFHGTHLELVNQIYKQIYHFLTADLFNEMLVHNDFCQSPFLDTTIEFLNRLEVWSREKGLGPGVMEPLQPLFQATTLLKIEVNIGSEFNNYEGLASFICMKFNKLSKIQIIRLMVCADSVVPGRFSWPMMGMIHSKHEKDQEANPNLKEDLYIDKNVTNEIVFPSCPTKVQWCRVKIPSQLFALKKLIRLQ